MSNVTLWHGDCLAYMRGMAAGSVDAVVTDPPYGVSNDNDYQRFTGGQRTNAALPQGRVWDAIEGDSEEFDPLPFVGFKRVVLWGANNFAHRLPAGAWYIWVKKHPTLMGQFMSDAEVAWCNNGRGVFIFPHEWDGFNRASERGEFYHPTQKPIALMEWCIERTTKEGDTVFDPYMGSGTTGVACVRTGRNFIGCEISESYFKIAKKRIEEAQLQLPLMLPDSVERERQIGLPLTTP